MKLLETQELLTDLISTFINNYNNLHSNYKLDLCYMNNLNIMYENSKIQIFYTLLYYIYYPTDFGVMSLSKIRLYQSQKCKIIDTCIICTTNHLIFIKLLQNKYPY